MLTPSTPSTSEDDCRSDYSLDPFDSASGREFLLFLNSIPSSWTSPEGDVAGLDPSLPLSVKKKVQAIDPCKGRCLITNATLDSGIKYTHCLPIHLYDDPDLIHRLEWYWGLTRGELDLDSEFNIFPVSALLSAMHDYPRKGPSWILIPEDHIVDLFFSHVKKWNALAEPCKETESADYSETWRGNLPELQEKLFKYRLFPLCLRMEGMAINYIRHPPNDRPQVSDITVDVSPFDRLPWVTSHLDPKFVIMEAGRKLNMMNTFNLKWGSLKEWFDERPVLRPLLLLYEAWSAPIPSDIGPDEGRD